MYKFYHLLLSTNFGNTGWVGYAHNTSTEKVAKAEEKRIVDGDPTEIFGDVYELTEESPIKLKGLEMIERKNKKRSNPSSKVGSITQPKASAIYKKLIKHRILVPDLQFGNTLTHRGAGTIS